MEGEVNTVLPTHGEATPITVSEHLPDEQSPPEKVSTSLDDITEGTRQHVEHAPSDAGHDESDAMQAVEPEETNFDGASTEECRGSADEATEAPDENHTEKTQVEVPEVEMEAALFGRVECLHVECEEGVELQVKNFEYKMDHPHRGVAIIFNNGSFSAVVDLPDRPGYLEEGMALKEAFAHLGFDVRYYQDLTVQNIVTVLQLLKREGHKDADCLCVTFMTHGTRQEGTTNDVIYGKDGPLWVENIISKFNGEGCRSLAGKPKLFFIQASRGTQEDSGVKVRVADIETDAGRRRKTIPLEADILLAQSTGGGYTTFPNEPSGSIYVQSLARTLVDYGRTKDIHWLLTRVNCLVAAEFESSSDGKRQMPVYRSTLTKMLTFPKHTTLQPTFVL